MEALRLIRALLALLDAGSARIWRHPDNSDEYYCAIGSELIRIRRKEPVGGSEGSEETPFLINTRHVNLLVLPLTEASDLLQIAIRRAVPDSVALAAAKRHALNSLLSWLEDQARESDPQSDSTGS